MSGKTVTTEIEIPEEALKTIEYYANIERKDVGSYVSEMMTDGYSIAWFDVEESVVKLKYVDPWKSEDSIEPVAEDGFETVKTINTYKSLREEFPPVSAGIDYHKGFMSATGFDVKIEDPASDHQKEMQKHIVKFNEKVFMDQNTKGIGLILDLMIDETLTVGCSAAEIVYDGWVDNKMEFDDWATRTTPSPDNPSKWVPNKLSDSDWKSLKGIRQLKIIDGAYHRIKPYRDPVTWDILYYTVDEDKSSDKAEPVKLLPWQVLWLSWNRRGVKHKGVSIIKPVAENAVILRKVIRDLGISIGRWSDKKYFFVLGDARYGRTWAPQHVANFSRDVKAMVTNNGTGMPVPAGFDIKHIGGEGGITDGGGMIDNLTNFICTGMKFPKSLLEQKYEEDKPWLAWLVTYGRAQEQVKNTIRDQLWRRHLNCKNGMVRRIAKQGVPVRDQEMEDIYVPLLVWTAEGKYHTETKVKMLKSLLDAANPVIAEMKFEIERDLADTLGYSEINLENARKAIALDRKIDLMDKAIDIEKKEMEIELLAQFRKAKGHLELIPNMDFGAPEEPELDENDPRFHRSQKLDEQKKKPVGGGMGAKVGPQPDKRLEGGVSRSNRDNPEDLKRGKSKKQRNVGESAEIPAIPIDITIRQESLEPIKLEIETKPQEILVTLKDSTLEYVDTVNWRDDVLHAIEKRIDGVGDIEEQNQQVYNEIRKLRREIKVLDSDKVILSEKDKLDMELKQQKIDFMKEWRNQNKEDE